MPDLDLSALRKVAEAANDGAWAVGDENPFGPGEFCVSYDDGDAGDITDYLEGVNACHIATFDPPTVLALLGELENLRITAKEDRQYVEETDDRVKQYLAKAWWEGVTAQWTHLPPGNRVPQSENPYRQAGDG